MWKSPLKMRFERISRRPRAPKITNSSGTPAHADAAGACKAFLSSRQLELRATASTFESERGQVGVKMSDGLDAAEIILQGDVLVGSVGVFVRQTEAN